MSEDRATNKVGSTPPDASKNPSTIVVSVVTILAVAGVACFLVWHRALESEKILGTETFKLSYQFLLLVVTGGAVALLFETYKRHQEQAIREKERDRDQAIREKERAQFKREEEKVLLHKFHSDLIRAYNAAKRVRRLLRGRARLRCGGSNEIESVMLRVAKYDKQMQCLEDVQLEFESLRDEVKINPQLFANSSILEPSLSTIEGYLRGITREYERAYSRVPGRAFPEEVQLLPITDFPRLKEFIGPHDRAVQFQAEFQCPSHEVRREIVRLITEP